ncbi:MAG: glutamine-hydrolyzing carbamoyl-phosphate synthase small subunit [Nitrospirae bacterium]|nr:glutamine-hydrolyzing carbamoyl-phosphate synthase small subunit [Nitrospirota bacterium]
MDTKNKKAILVLADGTIFEGYGFGAEGETIGEVVFNTSMTGYQEILTDSSYKGQIVVMTYTQIGNYGINHEDVESEGPKVEGFVVKECFDMPSNWRSEKNLPAYLKENRVIGIQGLDTRALTKHIRDNGIQAGIISTADSDLQSLLRKVRAHPGISSTDLVKEVTINKERKWDQGKWKWDKGNEIRKSDGRKISSFLHRIISPSKKKIAVYDFGIKYNILRHLVDTGFDISVVPAKTPAEEVLAKADAIVLSNGPGDPETVTYAIENTKKLIGKKPVMGICLGHQILGLALGGKTYKLKFGHHGGNHPVMDLTTKKVEITSQNHNYCVDIESLKGQVERTHKNLYDGTEVGMRHVEFPVFSVQYHPEAGPGPNDSSYIFNRFKEMVEKK